MSFVVVVAEPLNREPRKEGMDRRRRRGVVLLLRLWNVAVADWRRRVAVVMFVRVNVRMRVGRVGKRMYGVGGFGWVYVGGWRRLCGREMGCC